MDITYDLRCLQWNFRSGHVSHSSDTVDKLTQQFSLGEYQHTTILYFTVTALYSTDQNYVVAAFVSSPAYGRGTAIQYSYRRYEIWRVCWAADCAAYCLLRPGGVTERPLRGKTSPSAGSAYWKPHPNFWAMERRSALVRLLCLLSLCCLRVLATLQ